ncbi:MAG TPA: glycosyltransferase family 39 protein, partial [Syntrophorhabdaceae bacterium]|nr:glycosyltransferase family 39 protein [Syntrophorhabdaceae bacterium]
MKAYLLSDVFSSLYRTLDRTGRLMRLRILIVIALALVLFFSYLGATSLWDPDEPRQAIMAREMMQRGDYVHPYLNGQPYLEKPPFYPWMIVAAAKIGGALNEFASRAPSAIAATLLIFVVFFLGRMLVGVQCGFLSALVLATNYQYLSNARESVMDMTFAFFIGLTIFLNYVASAKDRRFFFALSFLPASIAILTKGPAGLVIPAGVAFVYLLTEGKWKRFIIPLIGGCLLSAAVASIWFFAAGEAYIREFILHQNITRYANAFDHRESFFYYFHKLFFNFLPWSMFLPFALVHAWKKKYWLPLIWFVLTFLFFEFSQSKRAIYLLSLYPASALICGLFLKDAWVGLVDGVGTNRTLKALAAFLVLLPACAMIMIPSMRGSDVIDVVRSGPKSLYAYLGLLSATGALFFAMLVKRSGRLALGMFIVYLVVAGYFYNAWYMPLVDKSTKSLKLITDELAPYKNTKEFYTLGFNSAGIIFYLGKPVHIGVDIDEIKQSKDDILLIVEDKSS